MTLTATRDVQVAPDTRKKPKIVARMSDWQYIERSLHRMMAGWGRHFADWPDKVAVSRHVWEQAECVRRLRERLEEFPGAVGNLDAPVSARLETLVNTVLLAPSHADAVYGMSQILAGALIRSYLRHVENAHPVHDAPTMAMLQEIVRVKEAQRLWLRDYRRRYPHTTDAAYKAAVEAALTECGDLHEALPVEGEGARPVGVGTDFRLPARPARTLGTEPKHDLMPWLEADFTRSVETRRLFWCYGYMMEMNLAEDQLHWIWDAHEMPWEFQQDVSRHLWDESRHGDSGYSRLQDFGIGLETIGFGGYGSAPAGPAASMTAHDLYEAVFFIGLVAETGHFTVKHEAYADFRDGGDLESAEMMLFDIIDETSHVQYAHKWLPLLAERAGLPGDDFKRRGHEQRERLLAEATERAESRAGIPRDPNDPGFAFYQRLLSVMRDRQPLSNTDSCPPRSYKPM